MGWGVFSVGLRFENCFESTHVVEQLSFSIIRSILIFAFNLILGLLFTFWGPNGLFFVLFFWVKVGFENYFGVILCSWTNFIFHVFFISDFWFWLDFRVVFDSLGTLIGYFCVQCRVQKLFLGSTHLLEQLSFSMISSNLIH